MLPSNLLMSLLQKLRLNFHCDLHRVTTKAYMSFLPYSCINSLDVLRNVILSLHFIKLNDISKFLFEQMISTLDFSFGYLFCYRYV